MEQLQMGANLLPMLTIRWSVPSVQLRCLHDTENLVLALALAFDLDLDLDLDLRDFRRPSEGLAEGGDGHGCPSSAEAP
ncbi:hypothetical protein, partial [Pseudomonas sp. TWI929]|uniref:hypothetical protein n=1 Tax=Pseudomonas sp. TWI929 TaxID=3136795 RepID=UPI003207BE51